MRMFATLLAVLVWPLFSTSALASAPLDRSLDVEHPDWPVAEISPELRLERAGQIRDAAAQAGMFNAVLLAGIGQVETGFAHCWSEATWACQGPASSSCGGGPVIAGAADGPCADEQGGLGMFQFDSGTFSDTLSTYGPDIVTMEGNVAAVVPFLVTRAIQSIEGVSTEQEALDWMNSIPVVAGDPDFEEWIYFVSWRYNGCKGCSTQEGKYRDGTLLMLNETGAEFWNVDREDSCELIPSGGRTIEENDECYRGSGPTEYWREVDAGHAGSLLWTKATDNDSPSNYAVWRLRFAKAGNYELKVYSDGGVYGMSTQAAYQVKHAGGEEVVLVDQSRAEGFISLGSFAFDAEEGYQIRLDDNTGEAWAEDPGGVRLLFDAVQVVPEGASEPDPDSDPNPEDPNTGDGELSFAFCAVSTRGPAGAWPLVLALFLLCRRRSRGQQQSH